MPSIVETVIQSVVPFIQSWIEMARATSPLPPVGASVPPASVTAQHPSDAVKRLQALINQYAPPTPLLKVDGLFGPLTDKALTAALKSFGFV